MQAREDLRQIIRAEGLDPLTYNPYADKVNHPKVERFKYLRMLKDKQKQQQEQEQLEQENIWQMPNAFQKHLGDPL